MSNLQDVAIRFKQIESSASQLAYLLERQRKNEINPPRMQAAEPRPPAVGEEDGSRRWHERDRAWELDTIARNYRPLEMAIAAHIESLASLKSDIEIMIRKEGRRSFWSDIRINIAFFILGSTVSAASLSATQVFAFLGFK